MLHDGPGFDRLCRDVAAARPDPLPMGVLEAEREADRRGLIELLEYAATYLSHPDVRHVADNFALPGSALAARCREAAANLESEAANGA